MGWMSNWIYADSTPNPSHRGQMTIPRQLGIRLLNAAFGQYRLTSLPVPELAALRNPRQTYIPNESFTVVPQTVFNLTGNVEFKTPTMELEINLEMRNNPQFSICAHNDVNEEVCFGFDGSHWFVDRARSGNVSVNDEFSRTLQARAAREVSDELTSIRIFLDVSSIEVFADSGLTAMTALFFPSKPFDQLYINHWSTTVSLSSVIVKDYRIYGLDCWFAESAGFKVHLFNSAAVLIAAVHLIRRVL